MPIALSDHCPVALDVLASPRNEYHVPVAGMHHTYYRLLAVRTVRQKCVGLLRLRADTRLGMNVPTCRDADQIDFLVASPHRANGVEDAGVRSTRNTAPADDALTWLLRRLEPAPATLWVRSHGASTERVGCSSTVREHLYVDDLDNALTEVRLALDPYRTLSQGSI